MNRKIIMALVLTVLISFSAPGMITASPVVAQTPSTVWSKEYGSSGSDIVYAGGIIQTSDGGYAILEDTDQIGYSEVVKLDAQGNIQWTSIFNATQEIAPTALIQTSDGGFAIVGFTVSASPNRLVWFTKTDADGNVQWTKYYGDEPGVSEARALAQTIDGGYIIAGDYASPNGLNGWDALVIKIDSAGNEQWTKTYGGPNDERFYAVVQSTDGGYAMAGVEGDDNGNIPHFWLVKTDSLGTMQWNRTYAPARASDDDDFDECYSMIQTADGGYALAGWTGGGYAKDYTEYGSFWLVKTDSKGNMQWNSIIGCWSQGATDIIQTSDDGYALSGTADSGNYSFPGSAFELAKTDSSGKVQWTYSGFDGMGNVVCLTNDGAYVLAGGGGSNLYAAKIAANGITSSPNTPTPTPSQTMLPTQSSNPTLTTPNPITSPNPTSPDATVTQQNPTTGTQNKTTPGFNWTQIALLIAIAVIAVLATAVVALARRNNGWRGNWTGKSG